jgi:small-conductance mechanosensitive channel/CRP-like cAMP-binding protein
VHANHLLVALAALVVTIAVQAFTVNRLARRKLRLSAFLFAAYTLVHGVLVFRPELLPASDSEFYSFERLALAAALINLCVVSLINPMRVDRVPDRFPPIVQDAIVIALLILVATFAFGDKLLATSAVSAVVLGFALQDTLGNAFAGLAIQSEKPFNIGHWIQVGDHEGRVVEVTWRATRLRTRSGNFVVLPNSEIAKAPITNYSEPAAPMRLHLEVGVSYDAPPALVKRVVADALTNCPLVLKSPAPDVLLHNFDASSITYRIRFWIDQYELDEEAADQVRSTIFYAFKRHDIEIPYPIQVEYSKEPPQPDLAAGQAERERLLAAVDLFAGLTDTQRSLIASRARTQTYTNGERIVREGAAGGTMYLVTQGEAVVQLETSGQQVAMIKAGGYFGEMSLLTGEPRTASVAARGEVTVLELDAEIFRQLGEINPQAVEQIGLAAANRRVELNHARASATATSTADASASLLTRMRRFLRLNARA